MHAGCIDAVGRPLVTFRASHNDGWKTLPPGLPVVVGGMRAPTWHALRRQRAFAVHHAMHKHILKRVGTPGEMAHARTLGSLACSLWLDFWLQ